MKTPCLQKKHLRILLYCALLLAGLTYCTVKNGCILNDTHGVSIIPNSGPYKGVGAYIINLDRSKERWAYIKPQVDQLGLPVERISAVDGKALSQEEVAKSVDFVTFRGFHHPPSRGTIGCSLSHIKTWKAFLESNYEYALVFEDDVSFDPVKLRAVVNQLIDIPTYWDITTFDIRSHGIPLPIKSLQDNQKLVVYLSSVANAGTYLINRKAATRLLAKAFPLKMDVDFYYTRGWEFGLKFTGIENPRLAHQTYGGSDIGALLPKERRSFIGTIQKRLYSVSSGLMRIVYNLTCYVESYF